MTTDRAALEKAIHVALKAADDREDYGGCVFPTDVMQLVISAAQAHLDTLPNVKTVWVVRSIRGSTSFALAEDALKEVSACIKAGASGAEIERVVAKA